MFYHLRPDPSVASRFNCAEIDNNVGYRCETLLRARAFLSFSLFLSSFFLFFLCCAPATEVDVNGRARDNKRAVRLNAVEWGKGAICCICDRLSAQHRRNVFIGKGANGSRDLFPSLMSRPMLTVEK